MRPHCPQTPFPSRVLPHPYIQDPLSPLTHPPPSHPSTHAHLKNSQTQPIHTALLPTPFLPYHPQPIESLLPSSRPPAYIPLLPAQYLPEPAPIVAAIAASPLRWVARSERLWGGRAGGLAGGEISRGGGGLYGCG